MTSTELSADCSRCAALCCVFLAIDRGSKFALDKPAGLPCPHLAAHRCSIHDRLAETGFSGCVQYDCFGAGQIVTQHIFKGQSWRDRPDLARPMAEAFRILREVQDLRRQLRAARRLTETAEIAALCDRIETRLTPDWSLETLESFDLAPIRADHALLLDRLRQSLTEAPPPSAAATRPPGPL